ncbi:MAG: hypothetical protein JNL80_18060 [Phycisphaerae bacterium]|jgi:hypothetical protein|nr:hypothetical protein [Phycisphaerae bacterium]
MSEASKSIRSVLGALVDLGIPHMLTGSLASNAYGLPRMSKDADFVVALQAKQVPALAKRVAPGLLLDEQMSFETTTLTSRWRLLETRGGFEIELFQLSDDPFDQERFKRRVATVFLGLATFLPTAEDVVVQKLRWAVRAHRPKDIDDALNVIRARKESLDWMYVSRWCAKHESLTLLESLRARA